jgi:hypothetical protein
MTTKRSFQLRMRTYPHRLFIKSSLCMANTDVLKNRPNVTVLFEFAMMVTVTVCDNCKTHFKLCRRRGSSVGMTYDPSRRQRQKLHREKSSKIQLLSDYISTQRRTLFARRYSAGRIQGGRTTELQGRDTATSTRPM